MSIDGGVLNFCKYGTIGYFICELLQMWYTIVKILKDLGTGMDIIYLEYYQTYLP